MEVIWSGQARKDLSEIRAFIARDSRYYARRVVQEIKDRVDALVRFPEIGRVVPEWAVVMFGRSFCIRTVSSTNARTRVFPFSV